MKNKHGLFSKKEWIGIGTGLAACFAFLLACGSCSGGCSCIEDTIMSWASGCGCSKKGTGGNVNALRLVDSVCDYLMRVFASYEK